MQNDILAREIHYTLSRIGNWEHPVAQLLSYRAQKTSMQGRLSCITYTSLTDLPFRQTDRVSLAQVHDILIQLGQSFNL